MGKSQWFIVSNRLPFTYKEEQKRTVPSSGGLVTAIKGIKTDQPIHWVGALTQKISQKMIREREKEDGFRYLPVQLNSDLYHLYYNVFCNDVLWPLLHYQSELVKFDQKSWKAYIEANELFAKEILKKVQPNDLVWIHDYHLFLVPGLLKKKMPSLRVGFFLHIPFPSSEVYRQLPVRREILDSLTASDLIGFHDYSYLRHFGSSVYHLLGIHSSLLNLQFDDHTTNLGVFPVSIDTESFLKESRKKVTQEKIAKYKLDQKKGQLILGVDRLDYIKGIELKLKSFQRLLEKNPELVGKVRLLQIAVPSRTDVPEYARLKHDIEQLVGEINGQFSTPNYIPINYIFSSVDFHELLAIYQTSDILFVSSKRDGMNLVCLEYIAVQNPKSPGVVVLSEFAGAVSTLSHSLTVNPWDEEKTSETLYKALEMPLKERKKSHQRMFSFLQSYTATSWAKSFMHNLQNKHFAEGSRKTITVSSSRPPKNLVKKVQHKTPVILLDYDGTLVPIYSHPQDAKLDERTYQKLLRLRDLGAQIAVVSGRPGNFLKENLSRGGDHPFHLASEHGARYLDPNSTRWKTMVGQQDSTWYREANLIMKDFADRTPDSFIEEKKFSLVWHYRNSPQDFGTFQARKLIAELEDALINLPIQVCGGKKIVEVKPIEASKGFFAKWFWDNHILDKENSVLICIGDDETDEDMFHFIQQQNLPNSFSLKIGRERTYATHRIEKREELLTFLENLLTD